MEHISKITNEVMVDLMVRCMLNPNNKTFYIGNVTVDGVKSIVANFAKTDEELVDIYWTAFGIAASKHLKELEATEYLYQDGRAIAVQNDIDVQNLYDNINSTNISETANKLRRTFITHNICPECGCQSYIYGCACPNCDYVED